MDSTKIAHVAMAARPMLLNHPRLRFLEGAPEGAAAVPVGPQVEEQAKEIDWKAEARKWESRAKENRAKAEENSKAAARLAELEESQKTEQQKLAERAEAAEKELAAKSLELERQAAVIKHGVPAEFADLVTGATPEALEASAEKVAALIAKTAPNPRAGVVPTVGQEPDRKSANVPLRDQIANAESAGDFKKAGALKALLLSTKH